ncbi:MAG TPA: TIM-barrel domain-containing protein [Deinococcales bacterium]|nr:TIM-barrel domain-containing protein [Deinococcales bacterium]
MRFHTLDAQPDLVRLHGDQSTLEISAPMEGVLRLRHAPVADKSSPTHPRLPGKKSWAVVTDERRPLSVARNGDQVSVQAGKARLNLRLDPGTWEFGEVGGRTVARCLDVRGEYHPERPAQSFNSEFTLEAPRGEAYLGFGEKFGPLDKRGLRFTFWNTDTIDHRPDADPVYQSVPAFTAVRDGVAWGLFLDEPWRSVVDIARDDAERLRWTSTGPELDVYLILGPSLPNVTGRYTTLTGRMPLPPLWALGAQQSRWGYENEADVKGIIDGYRSRNLPLDCIYLDIDYMDAFKVWTWDRVRYPDPKRMIDEALREGVHLITIVDPGVKLDPGYHAFEEAKANDFLVRTNRGDVLVSEVWPRPAVFPDFTQGPVREWWGGLQKAFTDVGVSGLWIDMNEPSSFSLQRPDGSFDSGTGDVPGLGHIEGKTLPDDARHGTRRHIEVHNVYALGMAMATRAGLEKLVPDRRPFILSRAAYAGMQRYAAVWTGDNSSYWAHLELSVAEMVGMGLSGFAFTGADIPGFGGQPTGELLARWSQLGIFYPVMRNHACQGTPFKEPWRYGEPHLTHVRQAYERRYRLLPYLYTLMWEAHRTGLAPMRPLAYLDAADREALNASDQFLFGSALLVAPITRAGQTARMAYLPQGEWVTFSDLQTPGQPQAGAQLVIAPAPADAIPVWLAAGQALPLTEPALHTTSANWSSLTWNVAVAATMTGVLYEDEGDGYGESRVTRLSGTLDDSGFRLSRAVEGPLAAGRESETIRLFGLPDGLRFEGVEARVAGNVTELTLPADWTSLTASR